MSNSSRIPFDCTACFLLAPSQDLTKGAHGIPAINVLYLCVGDNEGERENEGKIIGGRERIKRSTTEIELSVEVVY